MVFETGICAVTDEVELPFGHEVALPTPLLWSLLPLSQTHLGRLTRGPELLVLFQLNHLPLDAICRTIERNLREVLDRSQVCKGGATLIQA